VAEVKVAPKTGEIGSTLHGMRLFSSGRMEKRLRDLEYLYDLQGTKRYHVYDRMRKSDPKVAGLRAALDLPLIKAAWHVDPAVDEQSVDEEPKRAPNPLEPDQPKTNRSKASPKAIEVAQFVEDALNKHMERPFKAWLKNEALLYCDYGHAPFEVIWRMDPDNKWRFERFAYRPPATIKDIYIGRGKITGVEQYDEDGNLNYIPGEKLLWFVNDLEGDDWRGTSILRPVHKPWFNKEKMEILSLILMEKSGGLPVFNVPADAKDEDISKAEEIGEDYRVNEKMHILVPFGWEFDLKNPPASLSDALQLANYWDQQASVAVLASVLDLGRTQTGSRALGRTMNDLMLDSLGARAQEIEAVLNAKEGPVWQMVSYNFGNVEDLMPTVRCGSLQRVDLVGIGQALVTLSQAGMNFGAETFEYIREMADLPQLPDDEQMRPPPPPPIMVAPEPGAAPGAAPPTPANVKGVPTVAKPAAAPAQAGKPGAAPQKIAAAEHEHALAARRAPQGVERFMALDEMEATFESAKARVKTACAPVASDMAHELAVRTERARQKGAVALAEMAKQSPPMLDRLRVAIRSLMVDFYEEGRDQVAMELSRQKAGVPVADNRIAERSGEAIVTAQRARKKLPQATYKRLNLAAEIAARSLGTAMLGSAVKLASEMEVPEQAPDTFSEMATDWLWEKGTEMAQAHLERVGVSMSRMVSMGRADEAKDQADDVGKAIYSAILDGKACEACTAKDGYETEDLSDPELQAPNPDCYSALRPERENACRCVIVYEYSGEVAAAEVDPAEALRLAAEQAPKQTRLRREVTFQTDAKGMIVGKTEIETMEEV
jgi:hypothetical protein